ncbi:hypothetical protein TWF225_011550 [Orbilia oligospora]|uniref:SCP2 domain-containing protein n=1 Tax=Orbilia oligospora TaxID=2813651 RepID=A0A4Z0YC64_ORBOL|nr:hypothetical protein TWF703_002949 [Orbilia oligospora]KAF3131951.1 hypothetical protein TWF594_009662 [Orbilia oligospora]KAF3158210.1 hypothetical protein TWF788_004921 [Orbilia oligospora]KAF3160841.1 hypothetical protein TWF751_011771 [Orbilia oligospora]KAF3192738.1 hypothetical protein TWF225_011550 [Orbilia oligospora]
MSLKNDAFPASAAFDSIAAALKDETEKKDAIKKGGAVFCFTLKNAAGQTDSWFIDLKQTGAVGKGEAPSGGKADITLSLSEENFGKLVEGKANAQKLFMSGGLKVKGDMMKATRAEVVLKKAQAKKAKL